MKVIFFFFLNIIIFIYFGYPLLLAMIAFLFGEESEKAEFLPKVSILIPAHNEEKVISEKLDNCFALDYPREKKEIILILDDCTDNTESAALEYKDRGLIIVKQEQRAGKIAALNKVVPMASGEILVFTDANSIYDKRAVKELTANFSDAKVGCVCGELRYAHSGNKQGAGESIYWQYEKFIKRQESKLGALVVANGSIYAVRKELFSLIEEDLADDFVNPIRIKSKRFKVIYEPLAIARELAAEAFEEEFNRKVRIVSQGFKATKRLVREIIKCGPLFVFEFLFHKFLRWLVGIFLAVVFISNAYIIREPFYALIFILQLSFYVSAVLSYFAVKKKRQNKFLGCIFYFCMVNLAAIAGFLKALTGAQTAIWEIAKTTR